MKTCSKCSKTKSREEFYKDPQILDGLRTYCKVCWNAASTKWSKDNREHKNALTKVWRKKNPEKRKVSRRKTLLKSYGLTFDSYQKLLDAQNNTCGICHKFYKKMVVDHNHSSGKVRGILCNKCNRAIGLLQDSFEICIAASKYIKDNNE